MQVSEHRPPFIKYLVTIDEDLAAMYLTDKKNNVTRELTDHEELEVLLESFAKQVEEITNEAENIQVSLLQIIIC